MKLYTTNHKTKIGNEGVTAVNEIMLKFLNEIVWRVMNQAHNEGLNNVNLDHIEKILPQLVGLKKIKHFNRIITFISSCLILHRK
jgi:hypothetical protein